MVLVQDLLGFVIPLATLGFQAFGFLPHDFLFLLVALDLGGVMRSVQAGDMAGHLREVLPAGLGLVVVPLVGGFGLEDRGVVLVHRRFAFRGARLVAEHGANGGHDRGHHRDPAGKAVTAGMGVFGGVFDVFFVRAWDFEVFGHQGRIFG